MYIYIYICIYIKPLHKECSMKERYNTSKVFKQRKQLIWSLMFVNLKYYVYYSCINVIGKDAVDP